MVDVNNIKQFVFDCKRFVLANDFKVEDSYRKYIVDDEKLALEFRSEMLNACQMLKQDIIFFAESDPAVDSLDEIRIAYPGYNAITHYRIGHILRKQGHMLISRLVTEIAHAKTGIDIHPGATIACPFFIDHGTGIVIGETTIIGERVKIYQGVTLGALSLSKGAQLKGKKRHPTIGNDVTIYSGASILGDIKIGDNVTIGSNAFIIEDIPDNCQVTIGKPELVFKQKQ